MHTQPSSAHLESLALCFLSSPAKAADPAVTLASGKLLEVSGDVTVKSNAAGFPSSSLLPGHQQVACGATQVKNGAILIIIVYI